VLAAWLNSPADSGICWATYITLADAQAVMDWTEFASRTSSERETWSALWQAGQIDPSRPQVRAAIEVIFSGEASRSVALRGALIDVFRRSMTRLEKILASYGADGIYTLSWAGQIDPASAGLAMRN
jgi:hypothetical protein